MEELGVHLIVHFIEVSESRADPIKKYQEKIENLNYGTSIHGEHVFRLDGSPGV